MSSSSDPSSFSNLSFKGSKTTVVPSASEGGGVDSPNIILFITNPDDILSPSATTISTPTFVPWKLPDKIGNDFYTISGWDSYTNGDELTKDHFSNFDSLVEALAGAPSIPANIDQHTIDTIASKLSLDDFMTIYLKSYLEGVVTTVLPPDLVSLAPRYIPHPHYTMHILEPFEYATGELDHHSSLTELRNIHKNPTNTDNALNTITSSSTDDTLTNVVENLIFPEARTSENFRHQVQQESNKITELIKDRPNNVPPSTFTKSEYRITPVYFERPIPPPPKNIPLNTRVPWCRAWVPVEMTKYSHLSPYLGKHYRIREFNNIYYVFVIVCIKVLPGNNETSNAPENTTTTQSTSISSPNNELGVMAPSSVHFPTVMDQFLPLNRLFRLYNRKVQLDYMFELLDTVYNHDLSSLTGKHPRLLSGKLAICRSFPPPLKPNEHNRDWSNGTFLDDPPTRSGREQSARTVFNSDQSQLVDQRMRVIQYMRTLLLGFGSDYDIEKLLPIYDHFVKIGEAAQGRQETLTVTFARIAVMNILTIVYGKYRKSLFYALLRGAENELDPPTVYDTISVWVNIVRKLLLTNRFPAEVAKRFLDRADNIRMFIGRTMHDFSENNYVMKAAVATLVYLESNDVRIEAENIGSGAHVRRLRREDGEYDYYADQHGYDEDGDYIGPDYHDSSDDRSEISMDDHSNSMEVLVADFLSKFANFESNRLQDNFLSLNAEINQIVGQQWCTKTKAPYGATYLFKWLLPHTVSTLVACIPASTQLFVRYNADIYRRIADHWKEKVLPGTVSILRQHSSRKSCEISQVTLMITRLENLKRQSFLRDTLSFYLPDTSIDSHTKMSLGTETLTSNLSPYTEKLNPVLRELGSRLPAEHVFIRDGLIIYNPPVLSFTTSFDSFLLPNASVGMIPNVRFIPNIEKNTGAITKRCKACATFANSGTFKICRCGRHCKSCQGDFYVCECSDQEEFLHGEGFRNTSYFESSVHSFMMDHIRKKKIPHLFAFPPSTPFTGSTIFEKSIPLNSTTLTAEMNPESIVADSLYISSVKILKETNPPHRGKGYIYTPLLFDLPTEPLFPYPLLSSPNNAFCRIPVWIPYELVSTQAKNTKYAMFRYLSGTLYVSAWIDFCPQENNFTMFRLAISKGSFAFNEKLTFRTVLNDPKLYDRYYVNTNGIANSYPRSWLGLTYPIVGNCGYFIRDPTSFVDGSTDFRSTLVKCKGKELLKMDPTSTLQFFRTICLGVGNDSFADRIFYHNYDTLVEQSDGTKSDDPTKKLLTVVTRNAVQSFDNVSKESTFTEEVESYIVFFNKNVTEWIQKRIKANTLGEPESYVRALSLVALYLLETKIKVPEERTSTSTSLSLFNELYVHSTALVSTKAILNTELRYELRCDLNELNKLLESTVEKWHSPKSYPRSAKFPTELHHLGLLKNVDTMATLAFMAANPLSFEILRILVPDIGLMVALPWLESFIKDPTNASVEKGLSRYGIVVRENDKTSPVSVQDIIQKYLCDRKIVDDLLSVSNPNDNPPKGFAVDTTITNETIVTSTTNDNSLNKSMEDVTLSGSTSTLSKVVPEVKSTNSRTVSPVNPELIVHEIAPVVSKNTAPIVPVSAPVPFVSRTPVTINEPVVVIARVDPKAIEEKERLKAEKKALWEAKQKAQEGDGRGRTADTHPSADRRNNRSLSKDTVSTDGSDSNEEHLHRVNNRSKRWRRFPKAATRSDRQESKASRLRERLKAQGVTSTIGSTSSTHGNTRTVVSEDKSPNKTVVRKEVSIYRVPTFREVWKAERTAMWEAKRKNKRVNADESQSPALVLLQRTGTPERYTIVASNETHSSTSSTAVRNNDIQPPASPLVKGKDNTSEKELDHSQVLHQSKAESKVAVVEPPSVIKSIPIGKSLTTPSSVVPIIEPKAIVASKSSTAPSVVPIIEPKAIVASKSSTAPPVLSSSLSTESKSVPDENRIWPPLPPTVSKTAENIPAATVEAKLEPLTAWLNNKYPSGNTVDRKPGGSVQPFGSNLLPNTIPSGEQVNTVLSDIFEKSNVSMPDTIPASLLSPPSGKNGSSNTETGKPSFVSKESLTSKPEPKVSAVTLTPSFTDLQNLQNQLQLALQRIERLEREQQQAKQYQQELEEKLNTAIKQQDTLSTDRNLMQSQRDTLQVERDEAVTRYSIALDRIEQLGSMLLKIRR